MLNFFKDKNVETVEQAHNIIKELDLSTYIEKAKELNPKIDLALAEKEYRQHLLLCFKNQVDDTKELVVPTKNADVIWHEHILDTKNYGEFCKKLYGKTLHHTPGLKSGAKKSNAMKNTKNLQQSIDKDDCFIECLFLAYALGAFDDSEASDYDEDDSEYDDEDDSEESEVDSSDEEEENNHQNVNEDKEDSSYSNDSDNDSYSRNSSSDDASNSRSSSYADDSSSYSSSDDSSSSSSSDSSSSCGGGGGCGGGD